MVRAQSFSVTTRSLVAEVSNQLVHAVNDQIGSEDADPEQSSSDGRVDKSPAESGTIHARDLAGLRVLNPDKQ